MVRSRTFTFTRYGKARWQAPLPMREREHSSALDQMLIGWGFQQYHTEASFGGYVFSVVTGRGVPSPGELGVLERYLGSTAG